jgi:adenine phosphoribosyltransferase
MSDNITQKLADTIRTIPDFPIEGILFRDISPILSDGILLRDITERFVQIIQENNWEPELILGPESRGFIFGSLLASRLGVGFIPVRKPGKLPFSKIEIEYSLEYGTNKLEMHDDAISAGQNIIIIDDLLATGGTIEACTKLCEKLGGNFICNRTGRPRCNRKVSPNALYFTN